MTTPKYDHMKEERKEQQPSIADISIYIDAPMRTFSPAASPGETTHWFSTVEVAEAINDIEPSARIDLSILHTALSEAGFTFCCRPGQQGMSFRWMFREK